MPSQKALLNNLLRALVQEWGYGEVEAALASLSNSPGWTDNSRYVSDGLERRPKKRNSARLIVSEQVERTEMPISKKLALYNLADRFDCKYFLPSLPDVREFLIMMGEKPGAMKDRPEAFRRLLRTLILLPPEQLEQLVNSERHSGPSQLGPLSEAISSAAESLPRNNKEGELD